MEIREIRYRDGAYNKATVFAATQTTDATFVCLPAMGTRASYYRTFASQLSAQGFNVLTVDWRGQGHSSVRASYTTDFGYKEMIDDVRELVTQVDHWFAGTKKIIIGHSLGGQIGSLFAARYAAMVDRLVLITSCSVYYRGWDKSTAYKLRVAGNTFYPVSRAIGYFPGGKVRFGGRESRTVMKDWCRNALSGKYELTHSTYDYEKALQSLSKPVLSISVENDRLASKQAVTNLYEKFGATSSVSHVHLTSATTGLSPLTHFSWAKSPQYFVNTIQDWVQNNEY